MTELIKKGLYWIYWIIITFGIGLIPLEAAASFHTVTAKFFPELVSGLTHQVIVSLTILAFWPWFIFWAWKGHDIIFQSLLEIYQEIKDYFKEAFK